MLWSPLRHLLSELEEAGRRNDEQEQDRSRKMLNLEPETAHLLRVLVRSSQRTRLLEIGTSNGDSTYLDGMDYAYGWRSCDQYRPRRTQIGARRCESPPGRL